MDTQGKMDITANKLKENSCVTNQKPWQPMMNENMDRNRDRSPGKQVNAN